jgi:hypothetical protein
MLHKIQTRPKTSQHTTKAAHHDNFQPIKHIGINKLGTLLSSQTTGAPGTRTTPTRGPPSLRSNFSNLPDPPALRKPAVPGRRNPPASHPTPETARQNTSTPNQKVESAAHPQSVSGPRGGGSENITPHPPQTANPHPTPPKTPPTRPAPAEPPPAGPAGTVTQILPRQPSHCRKSPATRARPRHEHQTNERPRPGTTPSTARRPGRSSGRRAEPETGDNHPTATPSRHPGRQIQSPAAGSIAKQRQRNCLLKSASVSLPYPRLKPGVAGLPPGERDADGCTALNAPNAPNVWKAWKAWKERVNTIPKAGGLPAHRQDARRDAPGGTPEEVRPRRSSMRGEEQGRPTGQLTAQRPDRAPRGRGERHHRPTDRHPQRGWPGPVCPAVRRPPSGRAVAWMPAT